MIEIKDGEFVDKVEQAAKPVLVDFSAVWCPPCARLKPTVERISQEFSDKLEVFGVDVDHCPELSTRFNIVSVPTMIFFRGGKEVKKIIGLRDYDSLKKEVEALV